ncbi:hypothetical protein CAEBREN_13484 [Caenorhabditis brenneri]|uniref:Uncharacterized protein n=1 Tax=Caenorhabditis brenneri TaxID=135651 RepID=G0N828_CAEBE|nr:hypothetical protein CAEBREN_13484 [Caenorhabditis brenneri]
MSCFIADWKASYFSKLEQLDQKQVSGRDFFRAIPFCILIILTRFVPLASSEFSEEFLMELVDPFQFSATIMVVSWFSEKIIIQKLLLGTSEAELFGLYSTSLLVAHGATALTTFSVTHALVMEGPSSNNFVFSIITMSLFTVFFWFLHIQEYPLTLKRENPWKKLGELLIPNKYFTTLHGSLHQLFLFTNTYLSSVFIWTTIYFFSIFIFFLFFALKTTQ